MVWCRDENVLNKDVPHRSLSAAAVAVTCRDRDGLEQDAREHVRLIAELEQKVADRQGRLDKALVS
jgi:hypothetical protein